MVCKLHKPGKPVAYCAEARINRYNFPSADVVKAYWDPLSHAQTVRLVNLVRHFCLSCPTIGPGCKQLQELCQTIKLKLKEAVEKDIFIPIFNKT